VSSFKQKTVSGISWSILSQLTSQFFLLITSIILARLLTPNDFGLIGMITVLTGFANIFMNVGFSSALIQKEKITQEDLSSVFWFNIVCGILLTVIFIALSPLIAIFYEKEILSSLSILISFNFLLGSFNIVQRTILVKKVDFKTSFKVEIISIPVAGISAIILAYYGWGVWSIAVQSLLQSSINGILLWLYSSWRPSFIFKWESIRSLLKFSLNVFGNDTLNYWTRNIDNLLIGKFIGMGGLGIYSKAYGILMLPLTNVSQVIGRVLFPSLSLIKEDKIQVKRVFLKLSRVVALIAFPLMTGLFAISDVFVLTIFGPQWKEMIPLVNVFCILGISQSVGTLISHLYLSQGRADLMFKIGTIIRIILILSIVIGLYWGVIGVAVSYTFGALTCGYFQYYYAGGLVNLRYKEVLNNLKEIFLAAVAMGNIVYVIKAFLPPDLSSWILLLATTFSGIIIYMLFCIFFKIQAYKDVMDLLAEKLQKRPI